MAEGATQQPEAHRQAVVVAEGVGEHHLPILPAGAVVEVVALLLLVLEAEVAEAVGHHHLWRAAAGVVGAQLLNQPLLLGPAGVEEAQEVLILPQREKRLRWA